MHTERFFKFPSNIYSILYDNNPEAEAQRSSVQATLNYKTERDHARNLFGPLPQGYCKRRTPKS